MSGWGFASPALYGSQHPHGDGQEQPGAGGDAVEAAGADAGVAEAHIGRELRVLVVVGEDQPQAVAGGEPVAGADDGDPVACRLVDRHSLGRGTRQGRRTRLARGLVDGAEELIRPL